ncbi:MAG: TonB-dependent receptor [Tannerellaceae bacterium]
MKKNLYIMLCLLVFSGYAAAQEVKGYVYDASTNEALPGVNIFYKDKEGTKGISTDVDGFYEVKLPEGKVTLTFSYLGYEAESHPVQARKGQTITWDVKMKMTANAMDEVVVSVGRYEQKLSEITVSMNVLKATEIARQTPTDLSAVLNTMSGVDITDRQPSIRGGSGWTYGVGSRSQILVDGMSVLTPAVGEINWNMVPMENIDQVEVIKGASSVLYGSSALNGLINVRTSRPALEPLTRINAYVGIYGNPDKSSYKWGSKSLWKDGNYKVKPFLHKNILSGVANPMYNGLDFSHSRRAGNLDVSVGLNIFSDEGYREGNYNERFRIGGNLTWHDPNVSGLNYGLNANFLSNDYAGFFIWRSSEQAYQPSPLTSLGRKGTSFYIDPFLNYTNEQKRTTHRVKGRFYHKSDEIISDPTDKSIFEIADRMGFDYNSIPELINIAKDPKETLLPLVLPHIGEIMNGNVSGLANEVITLGNRFFPTATAPDYVDLISWVMGRTPLPSSKEELIPWLTNSATPKTNSSPADQTASYYLDYQFNKRYDHSQFTTGATFEHIYTNSHVSGTHQSDNAALFFQYDHKFIDKLNLSLGVRLEYYRVDSLLEEAQTKILGAKLPFKPIFRGGLNYELAEYSFIRASFGQGYRYPSIMEKFIYKDIGGVAAYPNQNLNAERGFNAELGIKQGYQLGNFKGFIDAAGFYTYYRDMIEFQFGVFNNSTMAYVDNLGEVIKMISRGETPGIGTRFENVNKAKIGGLDVSINGVYDIRPDMKLLYNLGYVFINPIDADAGQRNEVEEANKDLLAIKSKSNTSNYLKYRQKHTVKAVLDLQWKQFNLGTNMTWKSKTLAVDYFLVDEREKATPDVMDYVRSLIFSGLHDYWKEKNNGYFMMDLRLGMNATKHIRVQAIVNNLLNSEYSVRPMDVSAPRTFLLQVGATF